jgi:hypothetical protein
LQAEIFCLALGFRARLRFRQTAPGQCFSLDFATGEKPWNVTGRFLVVGLTSFDTTFMLTATFVSCVKILRALLLEARPGLDRDGHGLRGGF